MQCSSHHPIFLLHCDYNIFAAGFTQRLDLNSNHTSYGAEILIPEVQDFLRMLQKATCAAWPPLKVETSQFYESVD